MPRFPPGWSVDADGKRVSVSVRTKDFLAALELFRRIGEVAEEMEHHPDLHLERWNEVRIVSYSHDVGRLTERDEALAARIDPLLRSQGAAAP
jgi:4a-hydroxytetrahydrobiopterin dehydratase